MSVRVGLSKEETFRLGSEVGEMQAMSEDEEMWGNSALSFGRVCLVPLPLYFSNLCWKTYLTPM